MFVLYLTAVVATVTCRGIASQGFTCMTILSDVSVGSSSSYSAINCSNSTLQALPNSTTCLPFQGDDDAGAFVDWYSQLTKNVSSNLYVYKEHFVIPKRVSVDGSTDVGSYSYYEPKSTTVMADALLEFVNFAKWQRVAILTDMSHRLSLRTMEAFYLNFASNDLYFIQISASHTSSIDEWFRTIKKQKYRVIIVSLPDDLMNLVLCKKSTFGISWPDYAWLVVSFNVDVSHVETPCRDETIWFLHQVEELSPKEINIRSLQKLGYFSSIVVCKSVSKVAVISIHLWQNGKAKPVTKYRVREGLSAVSVEELPRDIVIESFLYFHVMNLALTVIMFLFITAMMALYIALRKELEVKATGVYLNILVFLGCYLILINLISISLKLVKHHFHNVRFDNFACQLLLWFNGCSIPGVLILSVLLVKLARIFRIFNYFHTIKKWSCHDATLALMAIGLTTPVLLSCILQSAIYTIPVNITMAMHHGELLAYYACSREDKPLWWLYGQKVYLYALCFVIITLAIKTRKIKDSNFKDTKKVIILVVTLMVISIKTNVNLFMFEEMQLHPTSILLLYTVAHELFILLCLLFLIAPKVIPGLKRKFMNKLYHQ